MVQLGYFTVDTPDIDKARAFFNALFGWTFD
jgi:predicted enzyme related to lactoylglutathione lyase